MTKKGKPQNVELRYRQSILSGWSDFGVPEGYSGDHEGKQRRKEATNGLIKQKAYCLFIPIVIKPAGDGSDGNVYEVSVPSNVDIPLSGWSTQGKKATRDATTIRTTQSKGKASVSLVYGVHEAGVYSLSHPDGHQAIRDAATLSSRLLGQIDTAIQCLIQQSQNEASNVHTGERKESPPPPQDLGTSKKPRRGKQVRNKIRSKDEPEVPAQVVGDDREILGDRPGNWDDRFLEMDYHPDDRNALEGYVVEF